MTTPPTEWARIQYKESHDTMTSRHAHTAPGVTGGYILAFCLLLLLWFGVGVLLLPVMAVLSVLHALRGQSVDGLARSHHLWLARHHLWATIALLLVVAVALVAIPIAARTGMTLLNTLAQAPNPIETIMVAWPTLALPQIIALGLVAFLGWLLVTLWLCIRLLIRWQRWLNGRQA